MILDGRLSHSIKPGDELWMIEADYGRLHILCISFTSSRQSWILGECGKEAPDGRDFVVVELDKLRAAQRCSEHKKRCRKWSFAGYGFRMKGL